MPITTKYIFGSSLVLIKPKQSACRRLGKGGDGNEKRWNSVVSVDRERYTSVMVGRVKKDGRYNIAGLAQYWYTSLRFWTQRENSVFFVGNETRWRLHGYGRNMAVSAVMWRLSRYCGSNDDATLVAMVWVIGFRYSSPLRRLAFLSLKWRAKIGNFDGSDMRYISKKM